MTDHLLFMKRQPDEFAIFFTVEPQILFCAIFPVGNLRILDRLEKFGPQVVAGQIRPHRWRIPFVAQQTVDDSVVQYAVDELQPAVF